MTAADNPRPDLVALLLQFEASAAGSASLYIGGPEAAAAIRAWADLRGHSVSVRKPTRVSNGKTLEWTSYLVEGPADPILPRWEVRCSLHDDHEVTAPAAQADPQVLARVQTALDGSSEVGMPLGMTSDEVIQYWPGALEAMPPGVDRLSVDSTDGDLWMIHRDGTERVWLAEDRMWSPAADRKEQPEAAEGSV